MSGRYYLICFVFFNPVLSASQIISKETTVKEKYISFNIPALAEPHLAVGPSAGMRITNRSEFFAEASFITRSPIRYSFNAGIRQLYGARVIMQYRYHFLQRWKPLVKINSVSKRNRSLHHPFVAAEFRLKPLSFHTRGTFINYSTNDTLDNYPFKANTITYGGALIFGHTMNLSADEIWKLEFTAGLGAKQRIIQKTTVPSGYKQPYLERIPYQIPLLYEELGTVLLPIAFRLRYILE